MNNMNSQNDESNPQQPDSTNSIPSAEIRQRKIAKPAASHLWWVTLICFGIAIFLTFRQSRPPGTSIVVHFDQGHGLHSGDPVRFRGIDVGTVESVVLSQEMDGIEAHILLHARADQLAREGSRFWIERPRVSLAQVGGLETVVGPKFVGVQPGSADGKKRDEFQGLMEPPGATDFSSDGLVVILESTDRLGLQSGSPVRYRGVNVGHVMSVSLAADAAHVETRVYFRPEYRNLVRSESKFWSNSGLDLTVGLRGFQLDADTLATIAAGGVAMATPPDAQQEVASEHRFELNKNSEDEWLAWQPDLALEPRLLENGNPAPNIALGVWRRHRFVVARFGRRSSWVLPLDDGRIIGPAEVLEPTEKGNTLEVAGQVVALVPEKVVVSGDLATVHSTIDFMTPWPAANLRSPTDVEDVILATGDNQTVTISSSRLRADNANWNIDSIVTLDDNWHGAVAIAVSDGAVLGICILNGGVANIATVSQL